VEIQDVEFNNNGKTHDEHSFSSIPKHSKHWLLHTILFLFILTDNYIEFIFYTKFKNKRENKII